MTDPISLLQKAISFAATKHKGQRRADGLTPYFAHVCRVAMILRHKFQVADDETLMAAYLHDVLEDTDTDYDGLAEIFGTRVADYVVALTKNSLLPKSIREKDYLDRLLDAPELVKIAKLADLFDNLSDRVGTPRFAKTADSARRISEAFVPLIKSREGRDALAAVGLLLERSLAD
jgi:guanosine-3',5'-bis(diphosphate) 3'-pyrophosphohydrolase